jgi:hypothetical protein
MQQLKIPCKILFQKYEGKIHPGGPVLHRIIINRILKENDAKARLAIN